MLLPDQLRFAVSLSLAPEQIVAVCDLVDKRTELGAGWVSDDFWLSEPGGALTKGFHLNTFKFDRNLIKADRGGQCLTPLLTAFSALSRIKCGAQALKNNSRLRIAPLRVAIWRKGIIILVPLLLMNLAIFSVLLVNGQQGK